MTTPGPPAVSGHMPVPEVRSALKLLAVLRQHINRPQRYLTRVLNPTDFGALRQLKPIGRDFGSNRGKSIDRYYIEEFLHANAGDIRGDVLEIGDNVYTRRFGDHVSKSDVLHVKGNAHTTIVADLTNAPQISTNSFDTIICTQTFQFIYDIPAAIHTLHRIVKPGGRILVTVPGIAQVSPYDMQSWGEYWRFTNVSLRRLFETAFSSDNIQVQTKGNVLTAVALLENIAAEELTLEELAHVDAQYQVMLLARAVK
jgi:SAM-dependent methyltransferase